MRKHCTFVLLALMMGCLLGQTWGREHPLPSPQCSSAIAEFFTGSYPHSIEMIAFSGHGFFDSAPQQIGSYDDCQDLTVAHYCLVNYKTPWTNWYPLRTGLCIPINCTGDDLAIIGDKFLPNMTTIHLTAMCVPKTPEPMETGAYVVLSILGVIAGFSVLAGLLDWWEMRKKEQKMLEDFEHPLRTGSGSLSAYGSISSTRTADITHVGASNRGAIDHPHHHKHHFLRKLFAPSGVPNLASLNGLRVLSMFWIILGHTIFFAAEMFANPMHIYNVEMKKFMFQIIANASLSVDSFFYMSGFLVGYLTLNELRKKGRIPLLLYYLHRIWRLTPPIVLMILIFWLVAPNISHGPWWYPFRVGHRTNCDNYWWASMLYINNFVPNDFQKQCAEWTWYAAADFQFYIICPALLYLYYKFPRIALAVFAILAVACYGAIAGITVSNHYGVNMINMAGGETSLMSNVYNKPWTRFPTFLIGIIGGLALLHAEDKYRLKQESTDFVHSINASDAPHPIVHQRPATEPMRYEMRWYWQFTGFVVSFTLLGVAVFGPYPNFSDPDNAWPWYDARTILYNTFGRTGFTLGVAIMMHILFLGHGYFINNLLSWNGWGPLARLTYSVLSSLHSLLEYDYYTIGAFFLAFATGTYILALFSYLLIERPVMNLERLFLPHHK